MVGVTESNEQFAGNLLIVSYWFPPAVGAAAERVGAFAKYLPLSGWKCHVLTAEHATKPFEYPGVEVHAVRDPRARRGQPFADYDPRRKPSRFKQFIRDWWMIDRFDRWASLAAEQAVSIAHDAKPDAILVSFPPASAVLLAETLHRFTKIPLIVDFRDTWIGPGGYEPRSSRARRKHEKMQANAIAQSRAVIAVSVAMAESIVAEQDIDREKVIVVPNGYDEADEAVPNTLLAAPKTRPFVFAHVGTVIPRNRPDLLFETVHRLSARGTLKPNDVRLRFVGNLSQSYLRDVGLAPLVETTGLAQRAHARRAMYEASALLLLTGDYVGRFGYNAKLFEYIRTGRAIVCLEETPGSNDRQLLERFAPERSFFGKLGDDTSTSQALRSCRAYVEAGHEGSAAASNTPNGDEKTPSHGLPGGFDAYHRRNQTAELARRLKELGIVPGIGRHAS